MATLSYSIAMPEGVPNLRFLEDWQNQTLRQINIAANSISIASASIVLIILLAMRLYDHRLVDRVSLRLTAAISFTDLVSSVALLIYCFTSDSASGCQVAAFLIIWLTNQYMFLTTAIAFNLQWLFLQGRYYNAVFEKWYYIISVSLSLLTAILPIANNVLGYDVAQGVCWFTPSYTFSTQLWEYGTYIGPQLACLMYCTSVVILVVIKLLRDSKNQLDPETSAPPESIVSHVVRRILLYPLTPLLTQLGFIVSEIYMFHYVAVSYPLNVWGVLTKALPGFYNLVGFLMDPAFMGALRLLKRDLIRRYGDTSPDLQRSNSHRSFDKRSYKIYADHGALDFVMPRDTTCASLAPLANDRQPKASNNRCMRWLVSQLCTPPPSPPPSMTEKSATPEMPSFLSSPMDTQDIVKPSEPCFSIPIFFEDQLDEAVPWRVLEADDQHNSQDMRRGSCSNTTQPSDREVDSWLELSEPVSPSRMSQWLNKRGDSFEIVRDRVARSSKSIRRWCRHQQQLHQEGQLEQVEEPDLDARRSRTLSGSYFDPRSLQSVPESHLETLEEASRHHHH